VSALIKEGGDAWELLILQAPVEPCAHFTFLFLTPYCHANGPASGRSVRPLVEYARFGDSLSTPPAASFVRNADDPEGIISKTLQ